MHVDRYRVTAFDATPGVGVTATVDGERISVGPEPAADAVAEDSVRRLREAGKTVVVVSSDERPVGIIALADHVLGLGGRLREAREGMRRPNPVVEGPLVELALLD